jgi:hypothetical protein
MTFYDASPLKIWSLLEYAGWVLVILGCAGEGLAEFEKFPKDPKLRHKLGKISWLTLLAGLAFELLGAVRVTALKDLEIAHANLRAEEANKEAAFARLEGEKLKDKLAWRTLGDDGRRNLAIDIVGIEGPLAIAYSANDPEALSFALEFSKAFMKGGCSVRMQSRTFNGSLPFGIFVPGNSVGARSLREALAKSRIPFSTDAPPQHALTVGEIDGTTALLFVGSKSP